MAWLEGWSYAFRKEITVTNANADYQTKVLIGKTSDAVGEDVDCGGHIADDFDDLRFTAADETTLLNYWIESIVDSGGTKLATVWVQNNAGADTTLYMYYGGTEVAVSDGDATFLFFEDAESGNPTDKWTENDADKGDVTYDAGTKYAGAASLKFDDTGKGTYYTITNSFVEQATCVITFRIKYNETDEDHTIYVGNAGAVDALTMKWKDDGKIYWYDGGQWVDTGATYQTTNWELYEIYFFAATNVIKIDQDGIEIEDDAHRVAFTGVDRFQFYGSSTGVYTPTHFSDNHFTRKYTSPEPSFAWGSEETRGEIYELSVTEGLKASDTAIGNLTIGLSITDGIKGSETIGTQAHLYPTASDTAKLSEVLSLLKETYPVISDGIDLSDTAVIIHVWELLASDGVKLSETLDTLKETFPSVADGVRLSETLATLKETFPVTTDGIKLSDESLVGLACWLLATDGVKLSDVASYIYTKMLVAQDGVKLSDTTLTQAVLQALVTDIVKLSEVLATKLETFPVASDTVKLSEVLDTLKETFPVATDGVSLSDAVATFHTIGLSVADAWKMSDTALMERITYLLAADGVVLSDAALSFVAAIARMWLLVHSKSRMSINLGSKSRTNIDLVGGG